MYGGCAPHTGVNIGIKPYAGFLKLVTKIMEGLVHGKSHFLMDDDWGLALRLFLISNDYPLVN
jgi:hypothetical protein